MRLYNHYLTILALLFGVTTVLLAGFGQQRFVLMYSMHPQRDDSMVVWPVCGTILH